MLCFFFLILSVSLSVSVSLFYSILGYLLYLVNDRKEGEGAGLKDDEPVEVPVSAPRHSLPLYRTWQQIFTFKGTVYT